MSKTERLYYADSHLTIFDATVIDVTDRVSGWSGVTLDRSAFYPTGGGQPSDVGFLNSAKVVECIDRKSTRLNSSHQIISYAVFCLKKKKKMIRVMLSYSYMCAVVM